MIHLVLIGPDWDVTSRFRGELVASMRTAGWRVSVVAGGAPDRGTDMLESLGVECHPVPIERNGMNPIQDVRALGAIEGLCRKIRPDVALGFTVKPVTYGLIGARRAGVPVRSALIAGLGYAFMKGNEMKRRLARATATLLYRDALKDARRVFFQNDDDRADFQRLGILRPHVSTTRVAGSGVNLDRFRAEPLPGGPMTFVMVARLLREKGVYEFVNAARILRHAGNEARFVLVGPLDTNPSSLTQAEVDLWVEEGVIEYVGAQADVRPYLRAAHVFTLPSYREGTPRSALEALAVGRPVLTVDTPGCREVVIDGITGRVVAPRSADAVADGMRWFIDNRVYLPEMSRAARAAAEKMFDVRSVNRTIIESLEADVQASRRLASVAD